MGYWISYNSYSNRETEKTLLRKLGYEVKTLRRVYLDSKLPRKYWDVPREQAALKKLVCWKKDEEDKMKARLNERIETLIKLYEVDPNGNEKCWNWYRNSGASNLGYTYEVNHCVQEELRNHLEYIINN